MSAPRNALAILEMIHDMLDKHFCDGFDWYDPLVVRRLLAFLFIWCTCLTLCRASCTGAMDLLLVDLIYASLLAEFFFPLSLSSPFFLGGGKGWSIFEVFLNILCLFNEGCRRLRRGKHTIISIASYFIPQN